jgi:hypothetical protein
MSRLFGGHRRRTSSNAPFPPNNGNSGSEGSWAGSPLVEESLDTGAATGGNDGADSGDSGPAPLSTSAYARRCRELMELDKALKVLG